jgi:Phage Terminase
MPPSRSSPSSGRRGGRKRCTFDGCRKLASAGRKRCDDHKPGQKPAGAAAAHGKLMGRTEPRLFTPPRRPLTRETSLGFEVIDFANAIGETLLPWQEWALIHALELNPDKSFRFRTVLILVARQSGKSKLARVMTLWRLYIDGAQLVLGAAQDVSQAREQWSYCLSMVRACPDLEAELENVRNVNGDEWFRVAGGGRYKITAANDKAGRGLTADLLVIDELKTHPDWRAWGSLESTTRARPRAQTWAMSNMGGEEAVVLNRLRDRALAGDDPLLFIAEWSGADGCELDDREAWAQANPALGYLFGEESILSAMAAPPAVFRAETLCQRVDQLDGAIDYAAWQDCADVSGTLEEHRKRIAACLDIAPDGQHVTLAVAAALPDGRVRVEIAAAWSSTDAARAELGARLDRIRPVVLGWYPAGPAAALAPVLRARPGVTELTGAKVGEACQGLADLVKAQRVVHPADPLLDSHIKGASRLNSGDGWRFTRKSGHVDAAYAAAGAVKLAQEMPPPKRARIRIIA